MTDPTPNSISSQDVPNSSARCLGSGSYEDGKWHWREGCDDCQRRYGCGGWIAPPSIIAFECEYRIGPDEIVAQGEHALAPLSPPIERLLRMPGWSWVTYSPWEREGYCDEQGRCWFQQYGKWILAHPESIVNSVCCLPAYVNPEVAQ